MPREYFVTGTDTGVGKTLVTAALLRRLLQGRQTAITGQSGVGKSSLLNAAAIPALEELGWFAATSRPWFDPIAEIKDEVLPRVFPDLQLEVASIDRAISVLGSTGGDQDPPFQDMAKKVWAALEGPSSHDFHELLTPFKTACLDLCRSPMALLSARWREGVGGAFEMGFTHGLYCLGCCWALMLVLFAGGVMNLTVIVTLTVWVAIEKLAPFGQQSARVGAALLAGAGVWMLTR